jgi:hypothetical protein
MSLDDLLKGRAIQQISLPDADAVLKLLKPVRGANQCRHNMATSECLLDEFQSRAAGCAQHNQFQALLVVSGSATARPGISLHIGYR